MIFILLNTKLEIFFQNIEVYYILMLLVPRYKTSPEQLDQNQPRDKKDINYQNFLVSLQQKASKKQLKFTQPVKYSNQQINTCLSLESSRELEIVSKLNQNRYTLNFSDYNRSQSLPKLNNLENVRHSLISEDAFHHFKRMNTKYGCYEQALRELERIEQQKKYKLRLQNKMKIKTRKNIFEIQKNEGIEDMYDYFVHAYSQSKKKQRNNFDLQFKKTYLKLQNSRKSIKILSYLDNRWKIGDFLDPIIRDEIQDNKKTQNIKTRLNFLSGVKRITNTCQIIQEENKSKTYLKLFSKYSQKLDSNLFKKKKKLQKVQAFFKN